MNELSASVQYNDFLGTVAADNHDVHGLTALAEKHGVDTKRYFVFGIEMYIGETRADEVDHPYCYFLLAETGGSVDGTNQYLAENKGKLPMTKHEVQLTLEDILLAFKRFKLILRNRHVAPIESVEFV